ncbi:DUF4340 domain-containing protein [Polyangium jinanense]|uniref:DUF4340 domain-containing protein n=1 Tax=Polyangium jinanense TaxID=2829994 RepID=A0A9X4AVD8_9BACT|nr:DUF4340 domain-containing protein [Polyangium jinanense]MDC3959662.1 DUF4340 domain-containing protein [Polyangium jinanense]MDC3984170.1 DUF4340 domain-containing protein [Polyangium jinanense]
MSFAKFAKKHATTLVLCVLSISAGAYVFVVDRGSVTTEEAEQRKKNVVLAWRPDEITELVVEQGASSAKLTRTPPDALGQRFWEVTIGGERFPAEAQIVDQLLGTLEFATRERVLAPDSVDRAASGLDAPRARIVVTTPGRTTTLAIGGPAPTPAGAAIIEVHEGDRTSFQVITKELVTALAIDPSSLRSRDLLPYPASDVARFEIEGPNGKYALARPTDGGDALKLDGPAKEAGRRASRTATDELFDTLSRVRADAFLSDEAARRASTPTATLTMSPTDATKPKGTLVLGGACPDKPDLVVALQTAPTRAAACVSTTFLDALSKPESAFVDRNAFFATIDEIHEVTLTAGDRRIELARKGTGFHERAPEDRDIEGATGRLFLESLLALRAKDFLPADDRASLGLDPPQGKVRIVSVLPSRSPDGGDDDRIEELLVGKPQGDVVPVLRTSDGAVLAIPADRARALFPSKITLRSPTVIDAPETSLRALRITEGDRVQHLERTPEGGFALEEPRGKNLAADLGFGTELATSLLPLRVERFVAERDDGSFGLANPRIVIEADLAAGKDAGARTVRLLLGAPTTGGSFARIDGDDAVFVIDPKIESAAGKWLLDRSIFTLDVAEIQKVTITPSDKRKPPLVLDRAGDALRIRGDEAATAKAAAIRDALADLVPEGAVSVGPPRKEEGLDSPAVVITIERRGLDPDAPATVDPQRTLRISLGAGDAFRGTNITYARRDGVDATYAIAQAKTRVFLDLAR